MQSGLKKTKMWIIEFEFDPSLKKDVLMGWNSSKNTTKQLKLNFDSLDDAILWCQKNSYQYRVVDQTFKSVKPKIMPTLTSLAYDVLNINKASRVVMNLIISFPLIN